MIGDKFIKFGSDYGTYVRGIPLGALIHDLEAPPKNGMAEGLVQWTRSEGLSPHTMSDPGICLQGLDELHSGAHAGSHANKSLTAFEVTGYASYTLEQWTSEPTFSGVKNQARGVANLWRVCNRLRPDIYQLNNVEWGSVPELRLAYSSYMNGGSWVPRLWGHFDVTQAFPGDTTHTDPGKGYPYRIFRQLVKQYLGTWEGSGTGTPGNPGTGTGGAEPVSFIDQLLHR